MRSCIGCKRTVPKKELIRFVLSPQGEAVLDYNFKLPGRGSYLCPDRRCIEKALKDRSFQRSFKESIKAPSAEVIISHMGNRVYEHIASLLLFAKKSGNLSLGTMSVETDMKKGHLCSVFIMSQEVTKSGKKLMNEAVARGIPCYAIAETESIAAILGNKKVVGLKDLGLSNALIHESEVLSSIGYRIES